MPLIDFAIVLLVIWAAYNGWRKGFVKELVSMAGFLLGLFIAAAVYSAFGAEISAKLGVVGGIIVFLLLWIVVPIVLGVVGEVLTKALKGLKMGLPNSILGMAVSLLKYLVLMSCLFNALSFAGLVSPSKAEASMFYEPVKNFLGKAFNAVSKDSDGSVAPADSVEEDSIVYIINREDSASR